MLERGFDSIVAEFMALDYDAIAGDKAGMLNLAPNDPDGIRALLGKPA